MKDYGIYEKVKLNGIVPGRLIRHTRADSAIIKSHWHPELEINTVFEGSSRFFINGRIEDESTDLKPITQQIYLCVFRQYIRKWQKITK